MNPFHIYTQTSIQIILDFWTNSRANCCCMSTLICPLRCQMFTHSMSTIFYYTISYVCNDYMVSTNNKNHESPLFQKMLALLPNSSKVLNYLNTNYHFVSIAPHHIITSNSLKPISKSYCGNLLIKKIWSH